MCWKIGFKVKLIYTRCKQSNRRQHNRKIIRYNPPFNLQVKTNIGKTFFQLLDKTFPSHHRLHKIINRNTVKISYSCMPNIASQISSHNKKIKQEPKKSQHPNPKTCDCQVAQNCPLNVRNDPENNSKRTNNLWKLFTSTKWQKKPIKQLVNKILLNSTKTLSETFKKVEFQP